MLLSLASSLSLSLSVQDPSPGMVPTFKMSPYLSYPNGNSPIDRYLFLW